MVLGWEPDRFMYRAGPVHVPGRTGSTRKRPNRSGSHRFREPCRCHPPRGRPRWSSVNGGWYKGEPLPGRPPRFGGEGELHLPLLELSAPEHLQIRAREQA
jgi:hypothetical protein